MKIFNKIATGISLIVVGAWILGDPSSRLPGYLAIILCAGALVFLCRMANKG